MQRSLRVLEDNTEVFLKKMKKMDFEGRAGGLCVGVHGPWSSGKTLVLTFIAIQRNEVEGVPIIANFKVKKVVPFLFLDDVEIIKELRLSILLIDEIRRYMDSYMSQGIKTRFVSNLTADLGKQSCDFYYSDQHYNAAPSRVKVNLSLILEPEFDEVSQWVTVYLYESINDYLMKDPFFYFGFYGPDFWKYYDTKYKIEDFKFRFKVDRFASQFEIWLNENSWAADGPIDKKLLNLWNEIEAVELTTKELSALLTYLDRKLGYKVQEVRKYASN